jgi:hypothetical protein
MGNTVPSSEFDLFAAQAQLNALLASRKSLVLATQDEQGACDLGIAPCVTVDLGFAVLLSSLAVHTRNLVRQPRLQAMMLEDEADLRQPFARLRANWACHALRLERTDERSDVVFTQMQQSFGSIVPLLHGLADFHVFILTLQTGRFVAGFGKAYRLDGLRVVGHVRT